MEGSGRMLLPLPSSSQALQAAVLSRVDAVHGARQAFIYRYTMSCSCIGIDLLDNG